MKTIITIGRQFGSGGKEIGIRVAKELGIPFYDDELLHEAAKQSGRGIIPQVRVLSDLAEAFNTAAATDLPLFLYETGERIPMREAVEKAGAITSAAIITGPEGGFEPYEAELARHMKLHICSMGPRIFRCETAPVAALSAIMYATGNMD